MKIKLILAAIGVLSFLCGCHMTPESVWNDYAAYYSPGTAKPSGTAVEPELIARGEVDPEQDIPTYVGRGWAEIGRFAVSDGTDLDPQTAVLLARHLGADAVLHYATFKGRTDRVEMTTRTWSTPGMEGALNPFGGGEQATFSDKANYAYVAVMLAKTGASAKAAAPAVPPAQAAAAPVPVPAAVPVPPAKVRAEVQTSLGSFTLELDAAKAPITVANFVSYAKKGHYDGTIFHRVIGGFMIQGGGFTPEMVQKPTNAPIRNEAANGLRNRRGTVAMARTAVVDSATSQFFVNVVDNAFLDHREPTDRGFGYAVFGKVVAGMDTVDRIAAVRTVVRAPHSDVPETPVKILKVTVSE